MYQNRDCKLTKNMSRFDSTTASIIAVIIKTEFELIKTFNINLVNTNNHFQPKFPPKSLNDSKIIFIKNWANPSFLSA